MNGHEQDETKIKKFGGIESRIIDITTVLLRIIFDVIS